MKKIAVIDLGTNGFRLQIAETKQPEHYKIIHREAFELKLAADGIDYIGEEPFNRGVEAMLSFKNTIEKYQVEHVCAIGTAVLRIAQNGSFFIETIKKKTGFDIELISGAREAELIYKGMRQGIPLSEKPVVMVDVGGGSVEFIIANAEKVFWAESFNVGVTILKQKFHTSDPITRDEINDIEVFLNDNLKPLKQAILTFKPEIPVIACGTLDAIVRQLRGANDWGFHELSLELFNDFYKKLTFLSEQELNQLPEIPKDKVEMLAASMILMDWLAREMGSNGVAASQLSMKAGILYEMTF